MTDHTPTPRTDELDALYGILVNAGSATARYRVALIAAERELAEAKRALANVQTERSDMLHKLADPVAVEVNMMRGIIARISMDQCARVHGEKAQAEYQALRDNAEYAVLQREALEAVAEITEGWHGTVWQKVRAALAKNPAFVAVDKGKVGGDKTVEVHGHSEGDKLVIDEVIEREPSAELTGQNLPPRFKAPLPLDWQPVPGSILPADNVLVVAKWAPVADLQFQTIQVAFRDTGHWYAWHYGTFASRLVDPIEWTPIHAETPHCSAYEREVVARVEGRS